MSTSYIAVDLETTGLDPVRDSIIEVATITFRDGQVVDEWSTLLNPYKQLPSFITELTGIDQSMVDEAPDLFSVRPTVERKLEGGILVGHNVGFDLGFLNSENLALGSHRVDTSTLASILFPKQGRYGLGSLTRALELRLPDDGKDHRALGDARRTARLFMTLQAKAQELDFDTLEEIVRAGQQIQWPETIFFEDALRSVGRKAFGRKGGLRKLYQPEKIYGAPLIPRDRPLPLETEEVSQMLRPGGRFESMFPGYEHRPQQVEMLEAIAEAFNQGQHLLIEAGTGTGKSIGYLLPAAYWSSTNQRRVVISTNTINLQDQLMNKDLPELDRLTPFEIRWAILKGRRNYLCTRLFQQMRHRGPGSADEMVLFCRILLWLPESVNGDIAEISLRSPGERLAWDRINSENEACTAEKCAQELCPLHQARRSAELAHILVVNHALLLADIASENRVLPEYTDLIMDEAHHLESAITNGLSFRSDRRYLESLLDELVRSRTGILTNIRSRTRESLPAETVFTLENQLEQIQTDSQSTHTRLDEFFSTLDYFLNQFITKGGQYAQQIRFTSAVRSQPDYDQLLISWDNLDQRLRAVSGGVTKLAGQIADLADAYDLIDGEELRLALISLARNLIDVQFNINALIAEPVDSMIYWAELYRARISLHAAPLHIGPLVEEHIFHTKESVILTSATLRTAAPNDPGEPNFDYLRSRLHAEHAQELAVGSPFDFQSTTLVLLPTDLPEPNQPGYQRSVEKAIIEVAGAIDGRTLVLFTSYSQLNATAKAIEPRLQRKGISAISQSEGASRQRILDQFREPDSRSVLLGTRSFWEGIDVPGEALQAVVIVKLPFDVPSDPIVAARSETYDNPFYEYSIPEAVLRFRQGFGRLIRRQDDEGIVLVLDKRILTKRYGQAFIDSLPDCTVLRQRMDMIAEVCQRWMNRDRQG